MTTFAEVEARPPARTLTVPPSAFKDDWEKRPKDPVCCGVRLIGAGDVFTARAEAAKTTVAAFPDGSDVDVRDEAYRDALLLWVVARGTCDPNDIATGWDLWENMADVVVFEALTPEGARFIYDAIYALHAASDPAIEATDADVNAIVGALLDPGVPPAKLARARRLLAAVAEELGVAS